MAKDMIWITKGGRPCKNKPNLKTLKKEAEKMTIPELMAKYDVSQATIYRYIKEAKQEPKKKEEPVVNTLTMDELIKENEALKKQVERLAGYKKMYDELKKKSR